MRTGQGTFPLEHIYPRQLQLHQSVITLCPRAHSVVVESRPLLHLFYLRRQTSGHAPPVNHDGLIFRKFNVKWCPLIL